MTSGATICFQTKNLKRAASTTSTYHQMMTAEWKKLEPWCTQGFVPMQFNRFITYPTSLFHSRFPFEAFGNGPEDGRLIWICFYDKGHK
jgi:hypothetical protein